MSDGRILEANDAFLSIVGYDRDDLLEGHLRRFFSGTSRRVAAISEGGQRRTITKIEAALTQFANKAATGDPKAIQASINIARELGDLKLGAPSTQH
jgi:PAS domain-containing protein